jgi:hypothetical protein
METVTISLDIGITLYVIVVVCLFLFLGGNAINSLDKIKENLNGIKEELQKINRRP